MAKPLIGLIVPPAGAFLPPDAPRLFGARADFAVEGLGIDEMTVQDFDAAAGRIAAAAAALGKRGVDSIAMLGTSLSFFRGPAFNAQLEREMQAAAGCPAVTATSAVVAALRRVRATRIAVATAYDEAMNERLRAYFEDEELQVASLEGMNIRKVREAMQATDDAIVALAQRACAAARGADALFISCGAFATGHLLAHLEKEHRMPAVSSTPAALGAAVSAAESRPARR